MHTCTYKTTHASFMKSLPETRNQNKKQESFSKTIVLCLRPTKACALIHPFTVLRVIQCEFSLKTGAGGLDFPFHTRHAGCIPTDQPVAEVSAQQNVDEGVYAAGGVAQAYRQVVAGVVR